MSKLPFFLFSSLFVSTSAFALNCADGATGCIDPKQAANDCLNLGYTLDEPDCDHYLLCPFNTDYKVCVKEKTPQEGKCHIGDIYFENGTCKNKNDDWDLADNPIGVVFMLDDEDGKYTDADSSDHGRIVALRDAGTSHFGLCVPNNSYLSWLTHMVSRQECVDMTKTTERFKNAFHAITDRPEWPDAPSEVSYSGQHPSCALSAAYGIDPDWTSEEGEDRCHDKGDGYDEPDDNCLNINKECGAPAAIHMAFDYKGLGTEKTANYPYKWQTHLMGYDNCGEWYLPSFYEMLALMADNAEDLAGVCPPNRESTGEMKERNILQKVNSTLWHLENETSYSSTMDGKYWTSSGVGRSEFDGFKVWVIDINGTKAAFSSYYGNTDTLRIKVRPVARF